MADLAAATVGVDHVGLSVRNLESTRRFFCDCLGWNVVGERPDYPAVFVSDGSLIVTLWQVESPESAVAFDRRANVGLHHLALAVADRPGLDALHERVASWPDVAVEFAPALSGKGPKIHFMVREPSGVRLEFAYDPRLEAARKGAVTQPAMPDLRILVLGAGGIGGYFGGRLAESGADVTFLVREGRRKSLIEDGLRIESSFGNATLVVKTVMSAQVEPVYDAILLACKAYDLEAAIDAVAPAVTPTGFVLPLLNGIAHMESLNRRFGENRVLGGTAKIQAALTPGGAIRQFNDWRTITFGEQSGAMSDRVERLAALYAEAKGIEALAVADIRQRMWEKLVHLATAATMTCLMRASVGEIVRTPDGRDIFLDQLRVSAAIAAANGHRPSDAFTQEWEQTFSQRDSTYSTSMLRDIERRGRTEVEHVLGFMLKKAKEADIPCHTLLLAYTHIKAFEERRAAGRLS